VLNFRVNQSVGSSLIEIVFILFLVSSTASAALQVQFYAARISQEVLFKTQAHALALNFIERLRANHKGWDSYKKYLDDKVVKGVASECRLGACTPSRRAHRDVVEFYWRASQILPQPVLGIDTCESGKLCVALSWGGAHHAKCYKAKAPKECVKIEYRHG